MTARRSHAGRREPAFAAGMTQREFLRQWRRDGCQVVVSLERSKGRLWATTSTRDVFEVRKGRQLGASSRVLSGGMTEREAVTR